jgi:hypothetical protein
MKTGSGHQHPNQRHNRVLPPSPDPHNNALSSHDVKAHRQ